MFWAMRPELRGRSRAATSVVGLADDEADDGCERLERLDGGGSGVAV